MRTANFGRVDLPAEQKDALKKAIRWEWFTIGYTTITITVVAFVLGNSQSMKTAWIEDMLSLIPQVSFLVALLFVRRRPTPTNPYGFHRAMGIGHLVAGVALLGVGGSLAVQSILGLLATEHPTIGTVRIFGHTVWLGWLMVGVMAVVVVGPFFYGPAKMKLAPMLHNKVLYADADMSKADWTTNAASIVGVLGIGIGWWWLDGAAALFISGGIVWDGIKNTRGAVADLMDQRARTVDDSEPEPLNDTIVSYLRGLDWVGDAGVRMRDQGQVFHIEAFVTVKRKKVSLERLDAARDRIVQLDWRVQDIVIIPVGELPEEVVG